MAKLKSSYHGAFFWVAAVSFVVPIVVAAKAFHAVPVTTKPIPHPDASGVDHNVWDYLLKTYVADGLVDYDGLSRDYLFRTYLRQLAECDPWKVPTTPDRLALLINAYNAFVINGVIVHDISDSVMQYDNDGTGFFDAKEHILAGTTLSLNQIEHDIIRKTFAEPRIHVALVCAARSCPAIRPEAYTGQRLDRQLADQSELFANDPKYVAYDGSSSSLMLSPILNWYGDDWQNEGGYLAWLHERVDDPDLGDRVRQAMLGKLPVAWFDYDWSLNSQNKAAGAAAAPAPQASFGSGSIPNE